MVRVFLAVSLDGFIAGPHDELDWLPGPDGIEDTFTPFMKHIGALLMGRRTYEVASGFEGPWPYGETPVLVATHGSIAPPRPHVTAVHGTMPELMARAQDVAGDKDVYVDGGTLIRGALDAGLVDDMTLTVVPTLLGRGISLFSGLRQRSTWELGSQRALGKGLVQLSYRSRSGRGAG